MTAVEFYDRTPIENAISSLTVKPDKIIFIGDGNRANKFLKSLELFFQKRDIKTQVCFERIKRNKLSNIVSVLSKIVETEEECVFDLTGGDDLVLVAMGIVYEKYKHKGVKIQRFNINDSLVTDCDNDGCVVYKGKPEISVGENIILHGGDIRYADTPSTGTYCYQYTEDFISDVNAMWEICAKNPGFWNARINMLEKAEEYYGDKNSLTVSFDIEKFKARLLNDRMEYITPKGLLVALSSKKLLAYTITENNKVTITYKNEQVKNCLTTAGTVLEQKVAVIVREITDEENNTPLCNDVMSGVHIDWDGKIYDNFDGKDIKNEIDVIAMHGITPVFISCKNGRVDDDELYKLETVANRFGSVYTKKILIATYFNKKGKSLAAFEERARIMQIKIISDVHKFKTDEEFKTAIKYLISK
ncbi:MAG: DUF1887 family protein [Ruminococcaceae bacterium]|nr:DUF1887 family protein [Oscillospiraceae bacterium]